MRDGSVVEVRDGVILWNYGQLSLYLTCIIRTLYIVHAVPEEEIHKYISIYGLRTHGEVGGKPVSQSTESHIHTACTYARAHTHTHTHMQCTHAHAHTHTCTHTHTHTHTHTLTHACTYTCTHTHSFQWHRCKHMRLNPSLLQVSEIVYVHSKLMVVDDRISIIGSGKTCTLLHEFTCTA